jgi:hypothetical protein
MLATPRKDRRKGRRKALEPKEAEKMLKELVLEATARKKIPTGIDIPETERISETITLGTIGLIPGRIIKTLIATKEYWKNNLPKWTQYMNQVQTYLLLNQYIFTPEEQGLVFNACLNYLSYQEASELSNKAVEDMELEK